MNDSLIIAQPELTIINGAAFCTSLQVAENFDKRHADVLRDIESTITQVIDSSEERKSAFTENLFQKASYTITNNLGHEVKKPMYLLTRDGFTLLAMSYTGSKAMQFKLAYMNAFNQMEATLKAILEEPETINQDQINFLEGQIDLVAGWFHQGNATHWLNNLLRFHLNTQSINTIRSADYPKALALIEHARQQGTEYLKIRIKIEEEIIKDYLCQGIPFTGTLSKKFFQQFKQRLPSRPNWKQVAAQLESVL
jgi:Rha family phage regulatory protein